VRSLDLRVDYNTRVPAKATTYMCQMFDLQTMLQTLDNHMVAVEPIINTREILHHMVLYGCK
ncbi:DBH-like monooxygenase protein 1, partial [Biomphalaria glabrata]